MVNDVAASAAIAHSAFVADITSGEFDLGRPVIRVHEVKYPDASSADAQPIAQKRAEVAGTAGDEGCRRWHLKV
jgi:hypothetical protein